MTKIFKMMKIKRKLILFISIILTQFSCSEWMDLKPPQGLIREEFWQTKEDVEAVVMAAYDSFRRMDGKLFKLGEIRADMVIGDNNQSLNEQRIMEGNIYPENWLCRWIEFYEVINFCNEVIKNASGVQNIDNTFTDYQLQGYLAEAHFLRALTYFYLVRIYKDVPLVLEPTETDDTELYFPKTSGDEILEKMVQDLEQYRPVITADGYTTLIENKGRATKGAFDALLADIALWRFDYENVIKHVENIERSENYVLLQSARWFELFYPGNSAEGIFELQFNNNLNQTNSLYGLTHRFGYNYDPSQQAIELFSKEFARELYRGEDISIARFGEDDFIIWKYVGRAPDGETARPSSIQSSANFIVYRYADVLLMKAEALSQLGRFNEALTIINDIRERADVTPVSLPDSKTAYEDAILKERALELAFEGKRWFDLLRMGRRDNYSRKSKLIDILVSNVPSTQKRILATKLTNPLGWYLPIHETEIERNKNLDQNPYYIF